MGIDVELKEEFPDVDDDIADMFALDDEMGGYEKKMVVSMVVDVSVKIVDMMGVPVGMVVDMSQMTMLEVIWKKCLTLEVVLIKTVKVIENCTR